MFLAHRNREDVAQRPRLPMDRPSAAAIRNLLVLGGLSNCLYISVLTDKNIIKVIYIAVQLLVAVQLSNVPRRPRPCLRASTGRCGYSATPWHTPAAPMTPPLSPAHRHGHRHHHHRHCALTMAARPPSRPPPPLCPHSPPLRSPPKSCPLNRSSQLRSGRTYGRYATRRHVYYNRATGVKSWTLSPEASDQIGNPKNVQWSDSFLIGCSSGFNFTSPGLKAQSPVDAAGVVGRPEHKPVQYKHTSSFFQSPSLLLCLRASCVRAAWQNNRKIFQVLVVLGIIFPLLFSSSEPPWLMTPPSSPPLFVFPRCGPLAKDFLAHGPTPSVT